MSFYTSLNGLQNSQTDLDVISNNIANANTNGFKASTASFADIMSHSAETNPALTVGLGSRVQAITQQFSLGAMQQTGNATDLAINGDGFFVTQSATSNAVGYTRDGQFTVSGTGQLVDSSGDLVQGFPVSATGAVTSTSTTSAVTVPLTNSAGADYTGIAVSSSGVVSASYSDGTSTALGAVALASFPDETGLQQLGDATWAGTAKSGAAVLGQSGTGAYGTLLSGTLENSNVDLSSQLVDLVSAQQNYQANAKAINTDDQLLSTIIQMQVQ